MATQQNNNKQGLDLEYILEDANGEPFEKITASDVKASSRDVQYHEGRPYYKTGRLDPDGRLIYSVKKPVPVPAADANVLLAQALDKLAAAVGQPKEGLTPEVLEALLARVSQSNQQGMKDALTKEREHPRVSAFSYPEGDIARPKPTLARETYFNGSRELEEALTPAEIDAYNAITRSTTARAGRWKADLRQNGTAHELHVSVPAKSLDDRISLPSSLLLILKELVDGPAAVDVAALAAQVKVLQAQLAAASA